MKIKSLEIKNFRSFSSITVDLDEYTAFVGPNGAGKSTVLCGLNIFFRQTEESPTNLTELEAEDFHNGNTKEPIEITVTFHQLSLEAQTDFAEYYRGGQLVVSSIAAFNEDTRLAIRPSNGQHAGTSQPHFQKHPASKFCQSTQSGPTFTKPSNHT